VRAVIQRVREASVCVHGETTGHIDGGLLILLGVAPDDGLEACDWLARKLATLRIFADADGRMNRSLVDCGLGALVVSQFTLFADCKKGRRPSFTKAAPADHAQPTYELFCTRLEACGVTPVERGVFGAHMDVRLHNDGPVTLILETP
jgi:D-aminoacyl-tRNA deacylase